MSTNQPPGGHPGAPEGSPAYAQPQDPWAGGFEPGVASVPTDPVPHPHYQDYRGDAWAGQQTVLQQGQYPAYVLTEPPRRRVGLFILVFIAVLVFGGGFGYAAWYVISQRAGTVGATGTTAPPATTTTLGFPYSVKVGDCFVNSGTPATPNITTAACSVASSYKVLKRVDGADIPRNAQGKVDGNAVSTSICPTGTTGWYLWQIGDGARDIFLCLSGGPTG